MCKDGVAAVCGGSSRGLGEAIEVDVMVNGVMVYWMTIVL